VKLPPFSGNRSFWFRGVLYVLLICLPPAVLLYEWEESAPQREPIVVTRAHVDGLRQQYVRQTGALPSPEEEAALIERFVDDEVLIREARAMGLDRGDPIVRRRLVQKMQSLLEEFSGREPPTEPELQAYWDAHRSTYRTPERTSLSQVFLSRNGEKEPPVARARRLLDRLRAGAAPETLGDPFLPGVHFEQRTGRELAATFGTDFVERLPALPVGVWEGPVPSSYGWHLVRVEARTAARPLELDAVRPRVLQALQSARRQEAVRAELGRLRDRYEVRFLGVEGTGPADGS